MFMQKYQSQTFAILRIAAGFLFLWHGYQKLFGGGDLPPHLLYIAGPIELFGGILIAIGLFTRWAAFIACGEMAYAYWTAHAPTGMLPINNHGELAVLYCFVFLFISAYGPGIWSVDSNMGRKIPQGLK